jgi:hypothetical protein
MLESTFDCPEMHSPATAIFDGRIMTSYFSWPNWVNRYSGIKNCSHKLPAQWGFKSLSAIVGLTSQR